MASQEGDISCYFSKCGLLLRQFILRPGAERENEREKQLIVVIYYLVVIEEKQQWIWNKPTTLSVSNAISY